MNEAAAQLGMTRTHFQNVTACRDGQATARDLAKLTRAIIVEFPEYADIFALPSVEVGNKIIRTHNRLLISFPGADGMKTGFICDSGFNIVASAPRATAAPGRRRARRALRRLAQRPASNLLENGFKRYFWKSVFGTTIDGLAIQASLSDGPTHLHDSVCGASRAKSHANGPSSHKGKAKANSTAAN